MPPSGRSVIKNIELCTKSHTEFARHTVPGKLCMTQELRLDIVFLFRVNYPPPLGGGLQVQAHRTADVLVDFLCLWCSWVESVLECLEHGI